MNFNQTLGAEGARDMNQNQWSKYLRSCALVLIVAILGACQSHHQQNSVSQAYDENLVAALLAKAETAMDKGQLIAPDKDSGLYYYRRVLLIAPDQPDARTGLEAIFDHYLNSARSAQESGDLIRGLAMLDQAEKILLPSKASKALREQILAEKKQLANVKKSSAPIRVKAAEKEGIEYLLSMEGLSNKDKKIRERLKLIAEHTRTLKGSVRIEARDDQENRWIYDQLKAAVPKFKLRADFRKSQYPKVVVLS